MYRTLGLNEFGLVLPPIWAKMLGFCAFPVAFAESQ